MCVLWSCSPFRAPRAPPRTGEAIRLLERLDELHSLSSTAPAEVPELSVGKALEEELAALKAGDERKFSLGDGGRGVGCTVWRDLN